MRWSVMGGSACVGRKQLEWSKLPEEPAREACRGLGAFRCRLAEVQRECVSFQILNSASQMEDTPLFLVLP